MKSQVFKTKTFSYTVLSPDRAGIPETLKALPYWVIWQVTERNADKFGKMPLNPKTGRAYKGENLAHAGTDFETSWAAFESGKYPNIGGVGIIIRKPLFGVDFDDCFNGEGFTKADRERQAKALNTYFEQSPSGKGVKAFLFGDADLDAIKTDEIELYTRDRFFTITGRRVSPAMEPRRDDSGAFVALWNEEKGRRDQKAAAQPETTPPVSHSNSKPLNADTGGIPFHLGRNIQECLDFAVHNFRNGAEWRALINGETVRGKGPSESRQALFVKLAYLFGSDKERMRQAFMLTGHYDRADKKDVVRLMDSEIEKAIKYNRGKVFILKTNKPEETETRRIIQDINKEFFLCPMGDKVRVFRESDMTPFDLWGFRLLLANRPRIIQEKTRRNQADFWAESPARREYKGFEFEPDPNRSRPDYYNLYKGLAVEPKAGDWNLMKKHIFKIVCGGDAKYYKFFLQYMAHLVQKPWERPQSAIVLIGDEGTGKGTVFHWIGKLFHAGHYAPISNADQFLGRFNRHTERALMVFADECFWGGDVKREGVLKALITEPTRMIEDKGKTAYPIANYVRLFISSNNDWVIPAGMTARRFFVLKISEDAIQSDDYFTAINEQMENGGLPAMLAFLQTFDISDFKPNNPPKTSALFDQKIRHFTPVQSFLFNALNKGTWGAGSSMAWEALFSKDTLFKFFRDFVLESDSIARAVSKDLFMRDVYKILPKDKFIWTNQPHGKSRLIYFAPLAHCRKHFEEMVKQPIDWDEPTEPEPTPPNDSNEPY